MLRWDSAFKQFRSRMTGRDILMLTNMLLFFIFGTAMLIRAPMRDASYLVYLMGFGFLLSGGYRLYLFYQSLKNN